MIPTQVRHPFPVVLVHGGGGRERISSARLMADPVGSSTSLPKASRSTSSIVPGTDDRRSRLHGGFPAQALTLERRGSVHAAGRESCQRPERVSEESQPVARPRQRWLRRSRPTHRGHGWQLCRAACAWADERSAGAPGAGGGRGQGGGRGAAAQVHRRQRISEPAGTQHVQHLTWRQAGADLLDKIGPAIIMTHSAGGPFGLLVAEARPNLVRATIIIEGAGGSAFGFGSRWGLRRFPSRMRSAGQRSGEIKTKWVAISEPGVAGYYLQEEPARKLPI